jgi:hypothetical protein
VVDLATMVEERKQDEALVSVVAVVMLESTNIV